MILKYDKKIERGVVILELETDKFTSEENALLEKYGEPKIVINKKYQSKFPVVLDRSIKTGFKIRVKFGTKDGNDTVEAAKAAEEFYEDVKELITDTMAELKEKDYDVDFENKKSYEKIIY